MRTGRGDNSIDRQGERHQVKLIVVSRAPALVDKSIHIAPSTGRGARRGARDRQ